MASSECDPMASFGIIADIQYADVPNGTNFKKDKIRYYRDSVNILEEAVNQWKTAKYPIDFVLQLGDIIDGVNKKTPGASVNALDKVLEVFSRLDCPKYHTTGNHELYNFQRGILDDTELYSCRNATVSSPNVHHRNYYHFSPVEGFRIIVLDTFDVSLIGIDKQSTEYQDTLSFFHRYNTNPKPHDNSGLVPELGMYVSFNGGVSERQLLWLDDVLSQSETRGERVIVAGHVPVCPDSTAMKSLCWNHDSIKTTLQRHHKCVLAYMAGHYHDGGYSRDELGISYITVPGVIETPPDTACFATVHVYQHEVIVEGCGNVPSYILT